MCACPWDEKDWKLVVKILFSSYYSGLRSKKAEVFEFFCLKIMLLKDFKKIVLLVGSCLFIGCSNSRSHTNPPPSLNYNPPTYTLYGAYILMICTKWLIYCIHLCVYTYIHTHIGIHMCVHIHTSVYMHTYTCVCVYIHTNIYIIYTYAHHYMGIIHILYVILL